VIQRIVIVTEISIARYELNLTYVQLTFVMVIGRCRFFRSVSVFGILVGIFSKSVLCPVSVFLNTAVSVSVSVFFPAIFLTS
jgi:hypothetical protein